MKLKAKEFTLALGRNLMNCADLAKLSGVSKSTIAYIKKGRNCKADIAGKIARALNVDVLDIFDVH